MLIWDIHHAEAEYAKHVGDPCVGAVAATTKEDAERRTLRGLSPRAWWRIPRSQTVHGEKCDGNALRRRRKSIAGGVVLLVILYHSQPFVNHLLSQLTLGRSDVRAINFANQAILDFRDFLSHLSQ
jgi:hypothetical protein